MAVRPEILAQLARMLGDDSLRSASDEEVRAAVEGRLDVLVDALVVETADSEDVFDRASGLRYAELRLESLRDVLGASITARLEEAMLARLSAW